MKSPFEKENLEAYNDSLHSSLTKMVFNGATKTDKFKIVDAISKTEQKIDRITQKQHEQTKN